MESNYKPNSNRFKEAAKEQVPENKAKPVVTGTTRTRSRLKDLFIATTFDELKTYVFQDLLVPAAKKTISEIIDMLLYGGSRGARSNVNSSRVSYQGYYKDGTRSTQPATQLRPRAGLDFNDVVFDNRLDAEKVLNSMLEMLRNGQIVRVSDFFDFANIADDNHTNNKYGWTNLDGVEPTRIIGGEYVLKLPKVFPLD